MENVDYDYYKQVQRLANDYARARQDAEREYMDSLYRSRLYKEIVAPDCRRLVAEYVTLNSFFVPLKGDHAESPTR